MFFHEFRGGGSINQMHNYIQNHIATWGSGGGGSVHTGPYGGGGAPTNRGGAITGFQIVATGTNNSSVQMSITPTGGSFWNNNTMVWFGDNGFNMPNHFFNAETIGRYNNIVKNVNSLLSPTVNLLNILTNEEVRWIRRTGKITWGIEGATVLADGYLMVDAFRNGEWWIGAGHAFDMTSGAIGLAGPAGSFVATSANSYVGAAKYFQNMVHWINTTGERLMLSRIIGGPVWW